MGDMNSNSLPTTKDGTYLRDLPDELALKVIDHGPTLCATVPGTWIDAFCFLKEKAS